MHNIKFPAPPDLGACHWKGGEWVVGVVGAMVTNSTRPHPTNKPLGIILIMADHDHRWDMMTPEAARPPAMAAVRPGEGTIGARRWAAPRLTAHATTFHSFYAVLPTAHCVVIYHSCHVQDVVAQVAQQAAGAPRFTLEVTHTMASQESVCPRSYSTRPHAYSSVPLAAASAPRRRWSRGEHLWGEL